METPRDDGYLITDARERMDVAAIHAFLTRSYWARGIPLEVVERSMRHSLCFGVLRDGEQVAFARVVTDRATFAYLADVFVLPAHRGHGLSKWMLAVVLAHPDLQGLRRISLATRDAHGLYRRFGFGAPRDSGVWMERLDPDVYRQESA